MTTLDLIEKNQLGKIVAIDTNLLPLKLIEMGCLPGNIVTIIQKAPFDDPLYLKVDETHLAIRKETAKFIFVKLIK